MLPFDNYFLEKEEPERSCLMALRDIILAVDKELTTAWKYRMPMFCYGGKMFCYVWLDKKTKEPYIGIVEGKQLDHPMLEQGKRSRMKILRVNPNEDLPIDTINSILKEALELYQ